MGGGTETELKLRLAPDALPRLRAHPALRALRSGRARRDALEATYFDTDDLALARHAIALRIRRERGRWVQVVKRSGAADGALAQREERAWDLGSAARRPPPDLARLAECDAGAQAARLARREPLRARFVTAFERTTLPLAFADGTRALAAIDLGTIHTLTTPRRSEPLCELELELASGDGARLYDLARALADLPLFVEARSKAQRGYALLVPATHQPRRAAPLTYAAAATAAQAFAAIVRNALAQVEGNLHGVLHADDAEFIHQMRVGLRRLRCALAIAAPPGLAQASEALVAGLRATATVLGRARDLDVLVAETLPALVTEAEAQQDGDALALLAELAAAAADARLPAREAARAAVAAPRFHRLLLDAGGLAAAPPPGDAADARAFAEDVLKRRHRKVARAAKAAKRGGTAERHALRVAAKKLRYALEFYAPLLDAERTLAVRDALAGVQDALGRMNDAVVAVATAAALPVDDRAQALLRGWALGVPGAQARPLARAWRRFARAAPPWKR